MQTHHSIMSIMLYKGTIIVATQDGCLWQWKQDIRGVWHWIRLTGRIDE